MFQNLVWLDLVLPLHWMNVQIFKSHVFFRSQFRPKMAKNALDIDEGRLREMIIEHNKGVTQKEAYKILQVVKDENKEKKADKIPIL